MVRHVVFVLCFILVFAILFANRLHDIIDPPPVFGFMLGTSLFFSYHHYQGPFLPHLTRRISFLHAATAIVASGQGLISFFCFGLSKANMLSWLKLFIRFYLCVTCQPYDSSLLNTPAWPFSHGSDIVEDTTEVDTETDGDHTSVYYESSRTY